MMYSFKDIYNLIDESFGFLNLKVMNTSSCEIIQNKEDAPHSQDPNQLVE